MKTAWNENERELLVWLEGELDHHEANSVLEELGPLVDNYLPLRCIMDLGDLTFMDSSGIAVILGVYRRLYEIGGSLRVENVPRQAGRVINAAGVDRIVPVRTAAERTYIS